MKSQLMRSITIDIGGRDRAKAMTQRWRSSVNEASDRGETLLSVDDVAERLGVQSTTVHRWCREGQLSCLKPGKSWRIRLSSLDAFLRRGERPRTLVEQLGAYVRVPDHLVAVAEDEPLLHRLDAAYFQIGDERDALLVKFIGGETCSRETLREGFLRNGLAIDRLEAEGRFCWSDAVDPRQEQDTALGRELARAGSEGREVWAAFNWTREVDLAMMVRQQEQLSTLVDPALLVVKTATVEAAAEDWTPTALRQAQTARSGLIRISHSGLVLSRAIPLPTQ
jgi:excisionase family DNA binding protein